MIKQLLAPTTSATQSDEIELDQQVHYPAVFSAKGLAGSEVGTLQHNDGTGWDDVYQDGSLVTLSTTHTLVSVWSPGRYRIDKDATAGAVGVNVDLNYFYIQ